jgi:cytochrome c-type biogenesis protein
VSSDLLQAFGAGLLNMVNPCMLPLYPAFLAYLLGTQTGGSDGTDKRRSVRWLGVVVLAGVLTTMLMIGLLLALLHVAVGKALAVLLPVMYGIVIVMGILLILQRNPLARFPAIRAPRVKNPILGAFLYGMLYGPMTLPCSGALAVGVFTYGVTDLSSAFDSVAYFVLFGLGFGLPLVILPWLAEPTRKSATKWLLAHHVLLERIAGLLLIAVGIYGIINDWDLLRNYLQF